jgi:tRNA G18 (ribose-2'-O)-methylase SpoU
MIQILSLDDERILEFRSLKDKALEQSNTLICETEKVVSKLLKSDANIIKIFANEDFINKYNSEINSKSCEVYFAAPDIMQSIVGHKLHHGVMALANRPEYVELGKLDNKILVLNGLSSPENIGTMMRNAAAFGVHSILIDNKTCSPYARRCIRVSMGNVFRQKIHKTDDIVASLKKLQEFGYEVYSTANQSNSIDLPTFNFSEKAALIIGSEGHGIQAEVISMSDNVIRIPIDDEVAHLNAACSSSIFLYNFTLK